MQNGEAWIPTAAGSVEFWSSAPAASWQIRLFLRPEEIPVTPATGEAELDLQLPCTPEAGREAAKTERGISEPPWGLRMSSDLSELLSAEGTEDKALWGGAKA